MLQGGVNRVVAGTARAASKGVTWVLGVEAYDMAEVAASDRHCNRIVQAFYPEMFATLGYPTRVKRLDQLWRFVDVMHETRTHFNMEQLLYGLTPEEFDLFKRATRIIDDHAQRQFGQRAHASAALLRALHVLRLIKIVSGDERPAVLEVGPGCGYVGMLLVMEGFPYVSTEVVQAFYLYQSHMLSHVATNLRELATDEGDILHIEQPTPGTAIHIPWWKWATLTPERTKLSAGIMTSNHVLCEMHANSLAYLSVLSRRMLSNHSGGGVFVFENWGYNLLHSEFSVLEKFMENGFRLCHNERLMSAMALADRTPGWKVFEPDRHLVPAVAKAQPNLVLLRGLLDRVPRVKKSLVAARGRVNRLKDLLTPPTVGSPKVPDFKPGNPLSRRLTDGLAAAVARAKVNEPELHSFLKSHFGGNVPRHQDEDFFDLIGVRQ